MTIKILADDVISKIAAGEVIERPASVVKELIENAIDAGANEISIRVEDSGKKLIEVSDNGCGMNAEDLRNAIQRHATSKLRDADDLFHIHTLGFRGEALAAAGSVSRMTIRSRMASDLNGQKITVDSGNILGLKQESMPAGTIVSVENLFCNVPARLKFLKSDTTEKNQIDTLVSRYAMAYPSIRWQYTHNQRPVLATSGNGKAREVLASIYGIDVARQLLDVDLEEDNIHIRGFISPVALTRSNRREMIFFVNGRWIQDIQLNSAVMRAYQSLIMVGRYPIVILSIEMDPEEIDVNVHPSKAEIRFRSADKVISAVHRSVRFGLVSQSPVPELSKPIQWQTWAENRSLMPNVSSAVSHPADEEENTDIGFPQTDPNSRTFRQENFVSPAGAVSHFPILRWIGQIGGTYILAEGPDGLYLIDQHAAHERVLFEELLNRPRDESISQILLDPEVVQLPPWQADLLEKNIPILEKLGFEIEPFGPSAFRIIAIPSIFKKGSPAGAIRSVVEDFEEDEEPLKAEIENLIAARVCKSMAVKGGQILSDEEQRALIRDLENCQNPRTCPHGRPTMIHLSINLLEQQFGRKGKI
ncbi:MAG TPA: DNA mismatch repair endonuclease MutL [Flexilinea sp.]|jgi:DNA mismatch repair protein MutL|nr:DNA mismatch repair endonuclease MutL [Flexilinea sp.]HPR71675.1 DNA mismatch repair endonuclease MutL [Flexilinea sp.]